MLVSLLRALQLFEALDRELGLFAAKLHAMDFDLLGMDTALPLLDAVFRPVDALDEVVAVHRDSIRCDAAGPLYLPEIIRGAISPIMVTSRPGSSAARLA